MTGRTVLPHPGCVSEQLAVFISRDAMGFSRSSEGWRLRQSQLVNLASPFIPRDHDSALCLREAEPLTTVHRQQ